MKAKHILFAAFSAVILMVGCQREEKNLGFPSLDVFRTSMSFGKELASDTLSFVTTRAWKITSPSPWISFDPASGEPSEGRTVVTVTVLPNDSYDRVAKAEVNIGFTSVDVAVSQLGKGSADERFIFKNDFDKEPATQTFGSKGNSWPYLDQSECWKNQKGSGVANVKYGYSGMSARNNSNSNGSYSDYDGSGVNNLLFGSDGYFAIAGLDVKGEKNLKISFGTEKYDNNNKEAMFDPSEFLVYVSKDTEKWVPVTYTYLGTQAGRWNIAEGTFTLSEAPASLSVLIRATVASAYRIDDLAIEVAEEAGAALNLDDPAAIAFAVKLEGQDTPPSPVGDTFFVHDFKTGGQGEFTINDVVLPTGLTYVWKYDSSYGQMKASAFANNVKYASESWVISPEVDLTTATEAYIEFEHTGRYFGTIANEAQLMVSKDNGATWNALAISNYPSGNDWNFVSSGKLGLASYVGSKIKFAFKYTSTEAAAGTWEIQKVTVGSGSGQVDPVDPVDPTGSSIKIGALSKDLTWNAATDTAYGDGFTGENDNVTISYFKNKSTTTLVAPDTKYDNIKVYKNAILIVSLKSGKTITGIKMNCAGTSSNPYSYDMTVEGGGTVKADGTTLTWTGNMKTFKAVADGGQIRPNDIEIFYAD